MPSSIGDDPRPVLRKELSRVFTNQRVIRAFEKIFDLIPPEFINQQEQIDAIILELTSIGDEFGQATDGSDLRAQLAVMQQQIEGIQQGPIL